jgi:Asp-tRNA(Asn)/Glu-tRNA(Gln) amidotransferase A subunit family amidase
MNSHADDLCFTPARELAALIRERELSPVELVDALLDRIDRVDPAINCYVTVDREGARNAAAQVADSLLTRDKGELGPLYGVPISYKDLTPTAGLRTTFGSELFADHVPDQDALIVARAKAAGAITLGKTTTPEFGSDGVTESRLTGITRNPWNTDYTTGGSSGGAAAATVAGISPLATGSDGGGSIRVPSSLCGAVGLKASSGRIPHSIEFDSFNVVTTVGPITRTVADNALLLSVIAGYDRYQPYSIPDKPDFLAAVTNPDVRGRRIAYSLDLGAGPIQAEVREAVDAAAKTFEELGAIVEPVDISLPDPMDYFVSYWGQQAAVEAVEEGVDLSALSDLGAAVVAAARKLTTDDFVRTSFQTRSAIFRAFADVFANHELMIWPTTKMVAYPHHAVAGAPTHIGAHEIAVPEKYDPEMYRGLQNQMFTEAVSHAGLPAITVPAGFTPEGLPAGLQLASHQYDDWGVLRAAAAFEQARPWAARRPPL